MLLSIIKPHHNILYLLEQPNEGKNEQTFAWTLCKIQVEIWNHGIEETKQQWNQKLNVHYLIDGLKSSAFQFSRYVMRKIINVKKFIHVTVNNRKVCKYLKIYRIMLQTITNRNTIETVANLIDTISGRCTMSCNYWIFLHHFAFIRNLKCHHPPPIRNDTILDFCSAIAIDRLRW